MAGTERLYRGRLDLGDGTEPANLEVWKSNGAAVAFEGGTQRGTIYGPVVSFTSDGRLQIDGTSETGGAGDPITWVGPDEAVAQGQWPGQKVTWPDGTTWTAATITWTQYGVTVQAAGHANRQLPGARTETVGAQRFIVDGASRYNVQAARRGCGCGK